MAFDAFLKIDGIKGESTDEEHPGEIQLDSFSFGVTQFTSIGSATGGAGAGKASLQDIHFSAPMNVASPALFQACVSGQHFQKAVLSCRKAGGSDSAQGTDFLKITLTDVLVSGYATGSHELDNGYSALPGTSDLPADQFSLNFHKISMLFTSPGDVNPTDGTTANVGVTGAASTQVQ